MKSSVDWHGLGARRPADVPSNPNLAYKDQWNGYADWLGTGNKHKGEFLSFEEARAPCSDAWFHKYQRVEIVGEDWPPGNDTKLAA